MSTRLKLLSASKSTIQEMILGCAESGVSELVMRPGSRMQYLQFTGICLSVMSVEYGLTNFELPLHNTFPVWHSILFSLAFVQSRSL